MRPTARGPRGKSNREPNERSRNSKKQQRRRNETTAKLTDGVEPPGPERDVRHDVRVDQPEDPPADPVQQLGRQQVPMPGVPPQDDEGAPQGEAADPDQEQRLAAPPPVGAVAGEVGGEGHGQLGRDDGARGEGDGGPGHGPVRPFVFVAVPLSHDLPEDQQDVGVGEAVVGVRAKTHVGE